MKTKIISIVVMLLMACNVMGEDLVYVYMKNGKCGFFPVSALSSMKVSKVDADNTQHSDYRTQTIITSDTTLSISLSEIDSIVFVNKEVKPFPNTESEIRESIDLTNRIAEETNLRMDSLKKVGTTDICIILDEIRKIDGVVFADVSSTQSVIHIIQTDGICINHLLNTCKLIPNENHEQEVTLLKGSALSPHRLNEIEENESIFIPQQGKALILAPFQDFFYKKIDYWKEQLGRLYDVEDYVFMNKEADITKFKGDYLSQFDFILIDTHGANETLEVLKSDNDNLWYKRTFELYAPEKFTTALASRTEYSYDTVDDLVIKTKKLSWNQIILVHEDESKEVYLAMDKSFIEGHSFEGKIVFASACQSAKDRTSSTSLLKAFINNGATIYIGFRETINPALAGDFNNGLLGFLTHGVSFGDFNKYWINSKYVAKVKESAIECKYNEPIETLDPNLYTYEINQKYENYEIFLKNPYPSLNLPGIENGEIIFEWNTELEECSTIVHSIEEEDGKFYSLNNNFTFKLINDLYIDGNLYKHIISKKNITVPVSEFSAGGHKWQISCYLVDSYGDKVCTYSSGLQDFTIPEPLQNLVISQNNVVVNPGSTTTVEITSGNGDYTVSVDKPTIATVTLSGTTITIKGVATGTAKVTVKDKSGQTAEINVKVWDNLTLSQSSVGIYAGYSATVEITSGSGHYTVSVDKPAVATASLSGSVITIKGVNIGSAVVTVTDTSTNQTAKINVTVSLAPTLVVSNSSVDLIVGGSSTVEITSGSGSYEITNSNDKVVQAVLEGAKITLTAKSEGNAVVTVKDKATGKTASVTITVKPIAKLVLSQSSVGLIVRGSTTVEITSGGGSYEITNSNDKVVQAVLEGTAINLTAKEEGYAVVTVKDKATGQTADIKVSIFSSHSMAETFYRMPTFTNIQDANTTPVTAPGTGTNPITVQNTRTNNTPRYLYTTWGEDGWAIANAMLPKTGYCFSCYFTIAADAGVSNCLEFALLPINVAVSANHMKLQPTNDYFFRFHQAVNSVDGKDSIWVNGDVVNNSNWNHGERNGETTVLKIGTKYHICVDVVGDKAKATIVSEKGEVVYSGTKDISALPNTKMGTLWFNTSGACTYQFDDVKLSYLPHEPFTVKPAEAIDLGLPSGTLWASWNVGAYAPEEYGGYYAWGETEIKDVYDLSSYTFYNNKTGEVINIGEDISGTEYDVAHVKWGGSWHMPTYKQQKELIDKCSWTRTNQNGVNGQLVTGPNGASIFLPAAGYCRPDLDMEGSYGFYWSSSFDSDSEGYSVCQFFNSDDCSLRNGNLYWGLSVRPVITVLTVSQSSVELTVGESTTVVITSGEGIYELSNSNTDIVQAVLQETTITLTAKKEGSAIITINDKATGQITNITVTVNPIPNLVLSQSSVELTIGESTIVEITSGSGNYEVSNSNANIVHATLDGTTITLTALSDGNAVITVKDIKYGHTIDISVTVNIADICVSESDLILIVGNSSTVVITSGNGIYEISNSNANVVQAVLEGKTITLTALAEGTAIVAVKDIFTGQTANISITVKQFPDLVISQNSVRLIIGESATVEISSGSGKYKVSVDNPNVVKATLSGSTITIESIEAGTAVVVVKDSNSGQTIDINIRVFNSDCPVADAIDLGLPSGTLWASWNVGSLGPEDNGGFFAWGETAGDKDFYDINTYAYSSIHIGDDIAGTEYDVAHVKWGESWCMPSVDQIIELINSCTRTWINQNGMNGTLVTGPNGNTIFLPAAGFRLYNFLFNQGSSGFYWSSTHDAGHQRGALCLLFDSDRWIWGGQSYYEGHPVRPVLTNSQVVYLKVSTQEVNLKVGFYRTINITSGSGSYTVESSNNSVATAKVSGSNVIITAINEGTATIIVRDTQTPGTVTIGVTVKPMNPQDCPVAEAIDLGLPSGTKWANWNIGASRPEEYGGYYAWGETEEKDYYAWSTYKYCNDSYITMTKYCTDSYHGYNGFTDGLTELFPEDDVATVNWGEPWHMPTEEQLYELLHTCWFEWTHLNNVLGILVYGPNGNTIFLPAAGAKEGSGSYYGSVGWDGLYWSSSLGPFSHYARYFLFFSSDENWGCGSEYRYRGFPVRAVCP